MIALDLITDALRLVGVTSPGQTLGAEDAQTGLNALNFMLEEWSTQELFALRDIDGTYNLIANQSVYTIGPTGDFVAQRPIQIENMYVRYQSVDYPIELISNEDYNAIRFKALPSPVPLSAYYAPTFPLGTITFWPVPTLSLPVTLAVNQQQTQLATISDVLSLAPGYYKAMRFNLALDLFPEYGREPTPSVISQAKTSKANIKRANIVPQEAGYDPALTGSGGGRGGDLTVGGALYDGVDGNAP